MRGKGKSVPAVLLQGPSPWPWYWFLIWHFPVHDWQVIPWTVPVWSHQALQESPVLNTWHTSKDSAKFLVFLMSDLTSSLPPSHHYPGATLWKNHRTHVLALESWEQGNGWAMVILRDKAQEQWILLGSLPPNPFAFIPLVLLRLQETDHPAISLFTNPSSANFRKLGGSRLVGG